MRTLRLYCSCGAAWTGDVPESVADKIIAVFSEVHNGPRHGCCDAETARRARAKAEAGAERRIHD